MLLLALASTVSAMTPIQLRINGETMIVNGEGFVNIPKSWNEKFLKGVYCDSPSRMKDADIVLAHFKQDDDYVVAQMLVDDDTYVITYKREGGIIDGALVLSKDDILFATDFMNPRGNKMVAKESEVSLNYNQFIITRHYITFVNYHELGGDVIKEDGSVILTYNIDPTGIITREAPTYKASRIVEPNGSVPGDCGKKSTVTELDKPETLGPGLDVILCITTPISKQDNAGMMEAPIKYYQLVPMENSGNYDPEDFIYKEVETCLWQERMMYRNPITWLDWLSKHPNSESMKAFSIASDELKSWLKTKIKSVKNKKQRKDYQKVINTK
jgi:hypothetical protein